MGVPALVGFGVGLLPWRWALLILVILVAVAIAAFAGVLMLFDTSDPDAGFVPILMIIPIMMSLYFAAAVVAGMVGRLLFIRVRH